MAEAGLEVRLSQRAPIALDVSFACPPRELLALVGPSGSGKSTVLRAIAGLVSPAAGTVSLNGTVWFDSTARIALSPRDRRIGFVFQHYGLFPHLSALGNVMESLVELPYSAREARARDLLARLHLAEVAHRMPGQLSGGQQQRVAVARALGRQPNVLLLDEPFAAVDRPLRERLYTELAELRRDLAIPIILVTHDLDEAVMLADRLAVLYQGRTLQSGLPHEVISRPVSAQVAQLVGLKNVFRAGVIHHDSQRRQTTIEWRRQRLVVPLQADFPVGSQVTWSISQGQLALVDSGILASTANMVDGTVSKLVRLGNNAAVAVAVGGRERPPLFMTVSLHDLSRRGAREGSHVRVALLSEGIHLMPGDRTLESESTKNRRMQPASDLAP